MRHSISASGISHVGPHKGITADYLRRLKDSGLTVWPYTVNDAATASRLRADGADEVFTDTPWELAKQLGSNPPTGRPGGSCRRPFPRS